MAVWQESKLQIPNTSKFKLLTCRTFHFVLHIAWQRHSESRMLSFMLQSRKLKECYKGRTVVDFHTGWYVCFCVAYKIVF